MPLYLHLFIHASLAVLSGYLVGRYSKNICLGVLAGFLGGFLIDLDHVLEYFFVFGLNFNIYNFFQGRQFLLSDKIYLIFHAWEWLLVLGIVAWLAKKHNKLKIFILALALGAFVHLISDVIINKFPLKFYSIIYRASQSYSAPKLLSAEQWTDNLEMKKTIDF